jgi:hypothetical protein
MCNRVSLSVATCPRKGRLRRLPCNKCPADDANLDGLLADQRLALVREPSRRIVAEAASNLPSHKALWPQALGGVFVAEALSPVSTRH